MTSTSVLTLLELPDLEDTKQSVFWIRRGKEHFSHACPRSSKTRPSWVLPTPATPPVDRVLPGLGHLGANFF